MMIIERIISITRSWRITEATAISEVCVSLLWYVHLCVYRQTRAQKVLGELPEGMSARKLLNRFSTIHLESNSRIIVFARRLFARPKRLLKFPGIRRTKFEKEMIVERRSSHRHLVTMSNYGISVRFRGMQSGFYFSLTDKTSFRDSSRFLPSH